MIEWFPVDEINVDDNNIEKENGEIDYVKTKSNLKNFTKPTAILTEFKEFTMSVEYDSYTGEGSTVKGMDSYDYIKIGSFFRLPLNADHSITDIFIISEVSYDIQLEKSFSFEQVLNVLEDYRLWGFTYNTLVEGGKQIKKEMLKAVPNNVLTYYIDIKLDESLFDKNKSGIVFPVSVEDVQPAGENDTFSIESITETIKTKFMNMFKQDDPKTCKECLEDLSSRYTCDVRYDNFDIILTKKDTEPKYKSDIKYTLEYMKNMVSFSYKQSRKKAAEFLIPYVTIGSGTAVKMVTMDTPYASNYTVDQVDGVLKKETTEPISIPYINFMVKTNSSENNAWNSSTEYFYGDYCIHKGYVFLSIYGLNDSQAITDSSNKNKEPNEDEIITVYEDGKEYWVKICHVDDETKSNIPIKVSDKSYIDPRLYIEPEGVVYDDNTGYITNKIKTGMSEGMGTVEYIDVREHVVNALTGEELGNRISPKKVELYNAARIELMNYLKEARDDIQIEFIDPKYIEEQQIQLNINDVVRIVHGGLNEKIDGIVGSYTFDLLLNKQSGYTFKKKKVSSITSLMKNIQNLEKYKKTNTGIQTSDGEVLNQYIQAVDVEVYELKDDLKEKYTKPPTGIGENDLSEDVKTKLDTISDLDLGWTIIYDD